MNKKDFWTCMIFNIVSAILFIEHLAGLELAFEFFIGCIIISLIVHIFILRDYIRIKVVEE